MAYKLTFQYIDKSDDWCEMTLWGKTKEAAYRAATKWVGNDDYHVVSLYEYKADVNIQSGFRVEEVA